MKILLLGGRGNLGTAFNEAAAERSDISLVSWDKEEIDITDRHLIEKKIADIRPEVIINTVAYNDVDACERDEASRQLARTLNVEAVRALGEAAMAQGCLLVHYSSDYVFSGDNPDGYAESATPDPVNEYGSTKAAGERELIKLSGRGLKWYLIRTARLFGPKGNGPSAKPSFFEIMKNLSEKQGEVSVVDDESGCFTYTRDLAEATLDLVESGDGFGIYHLANDGVASWFEAAAYFFRKIASPVKIKAVSGEGFQRPARRPRTSRLLNTKRPKLRSWQAAVDEYAKGL